MDDLSSVENKGDISKYTSNSKKRYSKKLKKKKRRLKKIFKYAVLSTVFLLIIQGLTSLSVLGNDDGNNNSVDTSSKFEESNILILVNREVM